MLYRANYGFSEWRREGRLHNRKPFTEAKWCLVLCVPFFSHCLWKGRLGHKAIKDRDYQSALSIWMPMAKDGDAEAQFRVGLLNEQGVGVSQNVELAVKWLARAATQCHWRAHLRLKGMAKMGTTIAQFYLGENYAIGCMQCSDARSAQIWFEKAAAQGLADAQVQLARTYMPPFFPPGPFSRFFIRLFQWRVPKRDVALALQWLQKATEQGSAEAKYRLGANYLIGHGVKQDEQAGRQLIEEAAEMGFAVAQISLASIYSNGENLAPDPERASYWFKRGEPQIDKECRFEALFLLAAAYGEGWGTDPDNSLAYKWWRLAEHKSRFEFQAFFSPEIKKLKNRMTKSEIRKAISLIEQAYDEEISSP